MDLRYKMAWIYMLAKARGQVSLELALEEMKERKKERKKIDNLHFFTSVVHTYMIVLMDVLGLDR